jgi:site-specific DNA-methyltransferase (adenine-specific)/modification methylase
MQHIDDESIDLVLTDPPYNIASQTTPIWDTRYKDKVPRKIQFDASWDKLSNEEFLGIMQKFIDETYRILKPEGNFYCFTSDNYLSYFRDMCLSKGMCYRQTCVWIKSNPVPQMRKVKYMHATELFFFCNKTKNANGFRWENGQRANVFYHSIVSGHERLKNEEGKTAHPTQKPLWLMEELIKYSTKERDIVLDPFMGVGTTCHAAKNLNRNYIGIELDKYYCKLAYERLKEKE